MKIGVFPYQWKTARVTPIFKEGDKSAKTNYQPISVLPVVSRLFKKFVSNQLYKYLNMDSLLVPCQSGFRACHSTTTALLKCTDDWLNSLDAKIYTGVAFFDLKNHSTQLIITSFFKSSLFMGIQGHALAWLKYYLSNHAQFTRTNGYNSILQSIRLGVPQGSCLASYYFPCISMSSQMPSIIPKSICTLMTIV